MDGLGECCLHHAHAHLWRTIHTRTYTHADRTSLTLWSACTLTHRFFTYESFKRRDRLVRACLVHTYCMRPNPLLHVASIIQPIHLHPTNKQLVAATAVFLGGKMAENARRLLDVVGHYYALKNKTPNLPPEKSKGACVFVCLFVCWMDD